MKRKITAGAALNIMEPVRIYDSSSTTGGYLSGLTSASTSSGLVGKYRRQGDAAWTGITIVAATAGTYTAGGFAVPTSGPTGSYELHIPNAAFVTGARWVEVEYYGFANMVPVRIFYELDAFDYQDGVRGGLTSLPNNTNLALAYSGFESGTASAGAASTITLRSGASAVNDYYKDQVVYVAFGAGIGQTNRITGYVGSTKVATVATPWAVQPDNTSVYLVLGRVG